MLFMCNTNSGAQLPLWAPVEKLISNVECYDGTAESCNFFYK